MSRSLKNGFSCFICLISLFCSCKHEPELVNPQLIINPSFAYIRTGDSISLDIRGASEAYNISLSPQLGSIRKNRTYVAPSSILNDSALVSITVSSGSRKAVANFVIVKTNIFTDTAISFIKTILPLMVSNCNFQGCHGNGSRAGKVSLINYDSTIKHVVKYQPESSLLYLSLIKTDPLRRMPPAGPLNGNRINWVKKWIEQGSLDN